MSNATSRMNTRYINLVYRLESLKNTVSTINTGLRSSILSDLYDKTYKLIQSIEDLSVDCIDIDMNTRFVELLEAGGKILTALDCVIVDNK